jgi:branched-chain amino acid transport system permease protein
MTFEAVLQVLLSGLLMGLIYALMAAGLSLIFGLMDVVNFAHGEFLMVAMYLMFGLTLVTGLDPLVLTPIVVVCMFLFGAGVYLGIIRFVMRAKANQGMVQVFVTFGLGLVLMGLAQSFFSPDYRSIGDTWVGGKSVSLFGIYLPLPQVVGALVSIVAFLVIWLAINRTDFGKALEATREDAGAVSLVGIDKNRVFALGWGYGSALVGLAGSIIAIFFYIYPSVGASFILIAFVTVALGGFRSVYGALAAGIIVGLVEASTAILLTPALKSLGVYAVYLAVVVFRPRGLFGSI